MHRGAHAAELGRADGRDQRAFPGDILDSDSITTLKGMQSKRSVTSAVVLQVLRWLKRAPESFLTDRHGMAAAEERLPEPGPGRILRFDTRAMHGALDARRQERGLTWRQVAAELPGFTASMPNGSGVPPWTSSGPAHVDGLRARQHPARPADLQRMTGGASVID